VTGPAAAINEQYATERFRIPCGRASYRWSVFSGRPVLTREQWYPEDLEIGWRLAREYWGHGYATEAAASWLEHGFTALGLSRIIAVTDTPNVRSIAVMRRLGMSFDHEAVLGRGRRRVRSDRLYSLTAEAWRSARR
jgi:RimJ/RimL family protein N-acetyltransferase